MAHPQMFDDDDPYLARLRPVALAFPAAEEFVTHGRPAFRAGKIFAVYGSGTKGPEATRRHYPRGVVLLPDEEDRLALAEDERFFVPAYYGPYGWLGLDLEACGDADSVDWAEVAELLDASYRRIVGPRLRARLNAEGGPADHRPGAPAG